LRFIALELLPLSGNISKKDGKIHINRGQNVVNVDGDKVILAVGLISQATLYQQLEGKVPEMYLIGDCVGPRRVGEATREGYKIGSIL